MKKNVSGINKILKFILGIAALVVGLFAPMAEGIRFVLFVVAAVTLW